MDAAREQFIENYVFMYVRVRKINIVNRIISCNYRDGNVNILGYFKKNIDRGYSLEIYRWNLLFHRSLAREVLSRVFTVRETSFRRGRKRDLWFRARLALESRSRKMNGASLIPGPLCYLMWINISHENDKL